MAKKRTSIISTSYTNSNNRSLHNKSMVIESLDNISLGSRVSLVITTLSILYTVLSLF